MDNVAIFSLGGMKNSSDAMFQRRRRILFETRKMIEEGGLEAFSIDALSKRAGVAKKTIYNAFGSKENVVALAIRYYFDSFRRHILLSSEAPSFRVALTSQMLVTLRNQGIANYLHAMAQIYFSQTIHLDIREALLEIGREPYLAWLRELMISRQLERGVDPDRLANTLSDLQWNKVQQWGVGAIDDDGFFEQTIEDVLLHLAGATRGAARTEVRAAFVDFKSGGPLRLAIVGEAQRRLHDLPRAEPASSRMSSD